MDDEYRTQLVVRALARRVGAARLDPVALYSFVMREEKTRARITCAPHQKVMIDFIMAHDRCLVRAPVGFGKTYATAAITLFLLGNDTSERGANISATVGLAQKPLGLVRHLIEESAELAMVFPHLTRSTRRGEPWTQTKITVAREHIMRDPSLVAVGDGGKLPGSRLSWTLVDDLLTLDNTVDEAQRIRVRRWFGMSVLDRSDAVGSKIAFINTPWFPDDLTYQLEGPRTKDYGDGICGLEWPSLTMDGHGDIEIRNTDWDSPDIRPARTPDPEGVRHRLTAHDSPDYAKYAGVDKPPENWTDKDDEVPLWPEVYPWKVLEEKRDGTRTGGVAMSAVEYNRAIRCKVRDNATASVKVEWIEACKTKARELGCHTLVESWPGHIPTFTGIDPAFGRKKKHNRTSIFTFAVLPSMHRRILDVQVGRWPGGEVITKILTTIKRFNSIACVEDNNAQILLKQWAKERLPDAMIRSLTTGGNKYDASFGVQSVFLEIEDGLWLIPNDEGTGICPKGVSDLVSALLAYTQERHTADEIMSMWIAREYARKFGAFNKPVPGRVSLYR